jgi:Tol biopolymer transport system component
MLAAAAGMLPSCSDIGDGSGCRGDECGQPGRDAASPEDATVPADADVLGRFPEPALIDELSHPTASDADPSVTGDGLELYFSSDRDGGVDIWFSTRDSIDDPWGEPKPATLLNSGDADFDPDISHDGLTIFLASTRPIAGAKGGYDLLLSTRQDRDSDWTIPELVPALNSADHEHAAVMDQSQTHLVLDRRTAGGISIDLYWSRRDSPTDPWAAPKPLDGLNTGDQEADPYLSPDGLTLYFNSNRSDGTGSSDLYWTTRRTTTSLFRVPDELDELNSESHEANAGFALDGRYVVFSSDRSGDQEVYHSLR